MLAWSIGRFYKYEKNGLVQQTESIIKTAADSVQRQNTTLNNMQSLMNDSERDEKMAFAIGMTGNIGKMRISFGEDTVKQPPKDDSVPLINKQFLKEHRVEFLPQAVKTILFFDTVFKAQLKQNHLYPNYAIKKISANDTGFSGRECVSAPFIINFYDPVVYRISYTIPAKEVWIGILPYVVTCMLLLVIVTSAFLLYERNYKLQLQMADFKESLFSNITHELKTPLSSLQLIVEQAMTNNDQERISTEHLLFAAEEISRMKLIVEKILSLGKMNKEQVALNKEALYMDEIIQDAMKIVQINLQHKHGNIYYHCTERTKIAGDRSLLTNAVSTILDNAIKYNPGNPEITITTGKENGFAILSVKDNGIGISPAYQKKVFQPFFRVPTGDIHDVKGHGLGLAFALQVITLHDGSISVISEQGKGSDFIISLPIL